MTYPTNISDSQWKFIKKTLNLDDRRRKYCLRIIWDAIHYLVKTGCQWRMLPSNFPSWQLVYYYYKKWSDLCQLGILLEKLRKKVRDGLGLNAEPSLNILDSQSVHWGTTGH